MLLNRELLAEDGDGIQLMGSEGEGAEELHVSLPITHVLNGAGEYAQNCVQVLETLTGFGKPSRDDPAEIGRDSFGPRIS